MLDFASATEILIAGIEQAGEERLFNRWINGYQHISFKDFKDEVTPPETLEGKEFSSAQDVLEWVFKEFEGKEVVMNGS